MTEKRIFELLSQIHPDKDKPSPNFNDYSRLIPEHVEHISKTIAKSIYDTFKEDNTASNSKRMDFIQIIRRWCNKNDNHFSVDENNYEFLLDRYAKQLNTNYLDDILTGLYGDFDDLPSDNVIEELKSFYNKYDLKMLEKQAHLDYVHEIDQKMLGDSQFFTNRSRIRLDTIDSFLNNFLSGNVTVQHEDISKNSESNKNGWEISRDNKVKFAYAILNMKNKDTNLSILNKILEELALQKNKSKSEIELIKYLWQIEVTQKLHLHILNLFPFLYEIPLINLCKELITISNDIEKFYSIEKFETEHGKLVQNIKNSNNLRFTVINMLNELFILSEYNQVLLQVIKIFNT